ncbi:hypothetical protein V1477_011144 [Vespula maculifrons]|uniref:Uncharacterized protein n=1 Tax=Vespula maculifrons TaxID=7453 RepID=A0ABD2C3Z4_VESMC
MGQKFMHTKERHSWEIEAKQDGGLEEWRKEEEAKRTSGEKQRDALHVAKHALHSVATASLRDQVDASLLVLGRAAKASRRCLNFMNK